MIGILIIILVAIVVVLALICHFSIDISKYEIVNSKVNKNIKILQLSDLHSREFGRHNKKLIKNIEKENPNIIVCTGDMINAKAGDMYKLELLIQELVNICKVYYIMGNREFAYSKEEYITLKNILREKGVIILENERSYIEENIAIYGINYINRDSEEYYTQYKGNSLRKEKINKIEDVLPKVVSNEFNILLVHSPNDFKKYAELGFDLILAGHIHGGVIRIPFLGGLLSPARCFFPKYDAGVFYERESIMCVSRGLGYGSLPFRLLNNPEIVVIDICKK